MFRHIHLINFSLVYIGQLYIPWKIRISVLHGNFSTSNGNIPIRCLIYTYLYPKTFESSWWKIPLKIMHWTMNLPTSILNFGHAIRLLAYNFHPHVFDLLLAWIPSKHRIASHYSGCRSVRGWKNLLVDDQKGVLLSNILGDFSESNKWGILQMGDQHVTMGFTTKMIMIIHDDWMIWYMTKRTPALGNPF